MWQGPTSVLLNPLVCVLQGSTSVLLNPLVCGVARFYKCTLKPISLWCGKILLVYSETH